MELLYNHFIYDDVKQLPKQSGCWKPCKYKKYRLIGPDPQVKCFVIKIYYDDAHINELPSYYLMLANPT